MEDLKFLEDISSLPGGSGDEGLVRKLIRDELKNMNPITDSFGNIYACVGKGPKVLAVGHMDEIGFMVSHILPNGMIKVARTGFVFSFGILCQIYSICTEKGIVEGVISLNPFQNKSNEYPTVESLLLDVGCKTKEEVEALGIEIGNAVIAKSRFVKLQNNELLSKAWDNRIGCAISVRVLQALAKDDLKVTFIGGGTVQEEVGCRGARALAINIKPDIAFSLDTSPANDQDGFILGKGPQLFVMDSATIGNKKLLSFVKEVAKKNNIPYQLALLTRGGTDASEFQNQTGGTPTLAIGIPVKYIHSPTSVINYEDYENAIKLMVAIVKELNEEIVNELKSFE